MLRIGTRRSKLALAQAQFVADRLAAWSPAIVGLDTLGDLRLDVAMHKIGDKGVFTAELDKALKSGEIDLAVHSLKDLPTNMPSELSIVAITERHDAADCVVFAPKYAALKDIAELPPEARVGTSSLRRNVLLRNIQPRWQMVAVRGNILTRLSKLQSDDESSVDAIVLAVAGLERLGLSHLVGVRLNPRTFIPAAGQGALAVQICPIRWNDDEFSPAQLIANCHHKATALLCQAERSALAAIGGGCQTSFGCYAEYTATGDINLYGMLGDAVTGRMVADNLSGSADDAEKLGEKLASSLRASL